MTRWILLCLLLLLIAGCGEGRLVEVVRVTRGPLRDVFVEPGRTRLPVPHRLLLPVDAEVGPVLLRSGDPVREGEELVQLDRRPFQLRLAEASARVAELESALARLASDDLEVTERRRAEAELAAFRKELEASRARQETWRLRKERLEKDLARDRGLAEQGAMTRAELERSELEAEVARAEYRRARRDHQALEAREASLELSPLQVDQRLALEQFDRRTLEHQLEGARIRVALAARELELARVVSPVDGVVLERLHLGSGPLPRGTPLLEVGDPRAVEVEVELLTSDALRISEGDPVEIEARGETSPGSLRRIEPAGFTKRSSLGVEQQRVRVQVVPERPVAGLGVGYRVHVHFVAESREGALQLPRGAVLEAEDGRTLALVVREGKLERREVRLGLRTQARVEILEGLEEGELVVAHADSEMGEGEAVRTEGEGTNSSG